MVAYIDAHSDTFGVEPICTTLQFAPSTYYAAKSRLPSARAVRDAILMPLLLALWIANYRVYGARKLWKAAQREGHDVGRDQVARLMRQMGIRGVNRSKKVRTTRPDETADRHPDRVDRQFVAQRPNQLWVTDLTYVPTWSGVVYVCFIVDAFSRMIVGWRVATTMRTQMVLDALEMARWSRGTRLEGLVCHSDAGSQFTSIRYGERLAELGAVPSIGSIGDSYDKGLASHCTSWCGWGTLCCRDSFRELAALLLAGRVGAGGRVEPLVLVVGLVAVEQPCGLPALDGGGVHAEAFGELVAGEHPRGLEPLVATG
jgi:putative transposase